MVLFHVFTLPCMVTIEAIICREVSTLTIHTYHVHSNIIARGRVQAVTVNRDTNMPFDNTISTQQMAHGNLFYLFTNCTDT